MQRTPNQHRRKCDSACSALKAGICRPFYSRAHQLGDRRSSLMLRALGVSHCGCTRNRPNPTRRSSADPLANTSSPHGFASSAIAGRADRHRPRSPAATAAGAAGIEQLTRCWPGHVDRRAPGARSAAGNSKTEHGHLPVATGAAGTCKSTDHPRTPPPARGSPNPSPNTARGFVDDGQHRPPAAAIPIPPPFPPGRERVGL